MSGLVWSEEAAASSAVSSSRARVRSSRRETSCRSPSSRAKKAAEAACTGTAHLCTASLWSHVLTFY